MNEASYYNNSIFYLSPIVRSRAFVTFFDPQAPNRWNIATLLVYTSLVLAVIVCLVLVKKYVKRHQRRKGPNQRYSDVEDDHAAPEEGSEAFC